MFPSDSRLSTSNLCYRTTSSNFDCRFIVLRFDNGKATDEFLGFAIAERLFPVPIGEVHELLPIE